MRSIVITTPEYQAGRKAWKEGRPLGHNPRVTNTCEWSDWQAGWKSECEEAMNAQLPTKNDAEGAGYRAYGVSSDTIADYEESWATLTQAQPMPEWYKDAYVRGWIQAQEDVETTTIRLERK